MTTCPACGFADLREQPWTGDSPSHEICPSCALHFGYDDSGRRSPEFYAGWGARWIFDGKPWFSRRRERRAGGTPDRHLQDQVLLENVMDSFDRLVDRKTDVVDVQALLMATARSLADKPLASRMAAAAEELVEIQRSQGGELDRIEAALAVLQPLRTLLAEAL